MSRLREQLDVEHLLVTRGELGMSLFSRDRATLHVRAEQREVYDVSGAGDTVLAALAASLCAGRTLDDERPAAAVLVALQDDDRIEGLDRGDRAGALSVL